MLKDVIHQHRHELRHSVYSSSFSPIRGRTVYCLALGLSLLKPFPSYRVYDVQNTQLVCSWCLFKVCVDLLNED